MHKVIYFFLLLYISIKLTPFGNNVNNIFLKGVFNLIRKVEIAGVNTAKLPVLSNEEKQELLVKIKNGDNEAREKFISRKFKISTVSHTTIYADVEKIWMTYFK